MSNQSGAPHFQALFEAALEDYRKQTGTKLIDHPLYKRLEKCDTVESITAVLQERAQAFLKFRGKDGKVMKSLQCAVNVLYPLSDAFLGEAISLVRPKTLMGPYLIPDISFLAIPASKGRVRWIRYPTWCE
jgi:hypothetical protein